MAELSVARSSTADKLLPNKDVNKDGAILIAKQDGKMFINCGQGADNEDLLLCFASTNQYNTFQEAEESIKSKNSSAPIGQTVTVLEDGPTNYIVSARPDDGTPYLSQIFSDNTSGLIFDGGDAFSDDSLAAEDYSF